MALVSYALLYNPLKATFWLVELTQLTKKVNEKNKKRNV